MNDAVSVDRMVERTFSSTSAISFRHLRAFRAAAHHQHFTRAAEAVGLSQPALSALIGQLETQLGVKLFQRTTRSVELTPVGRSFLEAANRILADLDLAVREAKDHALLRRGRLRIAALPSLCIGLLPDLAREFRRRHDGVMLSIFDVPGDEVVELAQNRQVDFGVGYAPVGALLHAEPILTDRLVALAAPGLLDAAGAGLSWQALQDFEVIAMNTGTTVRRLMDDAAARAGASLSISIQANQMPTAIAYARSGLGVAVLPSSGFLSKTSKEMVCVDLIEPHVERTLSVLRAINAVPTPAAEAFLDLLRAAGGIGRAAG